MCLMVFPFLAVVFMRQFYSTWMTRNGYVISSKKLNVDEDLPNFFRAAKLKDANWLVKESENLSENYGFDFIEKHVRT